MAGVFIFGQWQRSLLGFIPRFALAHYCIRSSCFGGVGRCCDWREKRNRLAVVWFSLMLGVVLWFVSEVVWAIYPVILGDHLFPLVADVFGLIGYAPILIGLGLQAWPFGENFRTKRMLSAILVTIGGGLLALIVLTQAISSQEGLLALIVDYAYPILDCVTLTVAVPVLLVLRRGTFWRPFLFLVLGLVLAVSAHMLSAWATSNGSYYSGHPLELLFDWGYLSAALGFYLMRKKMGARSL